MTEQEFRNFLSLGLCAQGLVGVREPVAYLYNGVRLPKLPETELPYAYILGLSTRYLVFSATAKTASSNSGYVSVGAVGDTNIVYVLENGAWVRYTGATVTYRAPIWCSMDVYDSNGTLIMEASEPAPVYE